MHETAPGTTFLVDARDYWRVLDQVDEGQIGEAFIGLWPSREDFGQQLLAENNAADRLADVPAWLRPYVRLDGTALVADMERAGIYVLAEVARGVCVFDGPIARGWQQNKLSQDNQ